MNELILEGLSAMLIGMGTVLSFLCLMICAMYIMSACIKKLNEIFPEAIPAGVNVKKTTGGDDSEIAAAIVAAIAKMNK